MRSSSRNRGWAMATSCSTRSRRLVPRSSATPYSVTTRSTSLRERETAAPAMSWGTILETSRRTPSVPFTMAVE